MKALVLISLLVAVSSLFVAVTHTGDDPEKVRADSLARELLQCADCCDHWNQEVTRVNLNQLKHQAARDSAVAALLTKNIEK